MILVTGGSQGMGKALASRLAKKGASVVIVARSLQPLEEAVKEISVNCDYLSTRWITAEAYLGGGAQSKDAEISFHQRRPHILNSHLRRHICCHNVEQWKASRHCLLLCWLLTPWPFCRRVSRTAQR